MPASAKTAKNRQFYLLVSEPKGAGCVRHSLFWWRMVMAGQPAAPAALAPLTRGPLEGARCGALVARPGGAPKGAGRPNHRFGRPKWIPQASHPLGLAKKCPKRGIFGGKMPQNGAFCCLLKGSWGRFKLGGFWRESQTYCIFWPKTAKNWPQNLGPIFLAVFWDKNAVGLRFGPKTAIFGLGPKSSKNGGFWLQIWPTAKFGGLWAPAVRGGAELRSTAGGRKPGCGVGSSPKGRLAGAREIVPANPDWFLMGLCHFRHNLRVEFLGKMTGNGEVWGLSGGGFGYRGASQSSLSRPKGRDWLARTGCRRALG